MLGVSCRTGRAAAATRASLRTACLSAGCTPRGTARRWGALPCLADIYTGCLLAVAKARQRQLQQAAASELQTRLLVQSYSGRLEYVDEAVMHRPFSSDCFWPHWKGGAPLVRHMLGID